MTAATTAPPERHPQPPSRPAGPLAGAWVLARLALRRDRFRIPMWVLGIAAFSVGSATSLVDVFDTAASRQSRAQLMDNPVLKAFRGPGYGLDDYDAGAMVAHEMLLFTALAAALMSVLMVVRHTRAEEEAGRTELIRSSVTGPYAAPSAALLVTCAVNVALGAVIALGLQGASGELGAVGSWAFGLSVAAAGTVFAAAAVLAAQVTEHARGAAGLGSVALAVAFVLRAVGDASGVGAATAWSWASPLGWAQATRPFVDERWWPLLLCLLLAMLLAASALAVSARRDVGAGLMRPRPGPPSASDLLVRPFGLPLRAQRGALVGWAVGLGLFGAAFGAVVGEIDAFLDDNPQVEQIFGAADGGGLLDAFLGTVILIIALLTTGYAVSAALRMRAEETEGRAEPLLATPLPRTRWAAGHLTVTLLGSAGVLLAGCLGLGVTSGIDQGEAALVGDMLVAGLAYVPAVWLVVGVAVALFGLWPRGTAAAWALLAYAAFEGLLAEVVGLPDEARALSPYHHVPELPAPSLASASVAALTAVAALLIAVGLAAFRRRDVEGR